MTDLWCNAYISDTSYTCNKKDLKFSFTDPLFLPNLVSKISGKILEVLQIVISKNRICGMIHYSDNWIYVLQIHSFFVSNDRIMKLRMIGFFEILVYNDKIGSMRKEFFYSVDNANLLT